MPEPNVLYIVTAVVVAGLVLWVAYVLKTAKQPWERGLAAASPGVPPVVAADGAAKVEAKNDEAPEAEKAESNQEPESDLEPRVKAE